MENDLGRIGFKVDPLRFYGTKMLILSKIDEKEISRVNHES